MGTVLLPSTTTTISLLLSLNKEDLSCCYLLTYLSAYSASVAMPYEHMLLCRRLAAALLETHKLSS